MFQVAIWKLILKTEKMNQGKEAHAHEYGNRNKGKDKFPEGPLFWTLAEDGRVARPIGLN